jgi:8-oxo-dGTP diphosphatase
MLGAQQPPAPTLRDVAWQAVLRAGFPLLRRWWRLRGRAPQGALVAVHVGGKLLVLRSSYRTAWNFPGGSLRRGETPEAAARRELLEEIGVTAGVLTPFGEASGKWEGNRGHVHLFELRLDRMPDLRLDNREIIGAMLVSPEQIRTMPVTGAVACYVRRRFVSA